jgi:hypothetical protein
MINEIKEIVQNYINNAKLCSLMLGTVVDSGIMMNEKLTIPDELIKGNLKKFASQGDKVRIIRNHGGKEFYVVEIIDKAFITKGSIIALSLNGSTNEYRVEDVKI